MRENFSKLIRWKLFKFAVENSFKNLPAKEQAKFEILQCLSEIFYLP